MISPAKFTLSVHLFALLKDLAGQAEINIDLTTGATIHEVRLAVIKACPALEGILPTAIAAVNHEFAFADQVVQAGDEVAFFPMVSGGERASHPEIALLAETPIDLNELTAQIVEVTTGAVALFSGYVRGQTQTAEGALQTSALHYEAYAPMALVKMRQVISEIREKWPLVQGIAVVQRIGLLKLGEPTVLIACAAAHRDDGCFEAARHGIDRLKQIVPVWKKEIGPDGQTWVEGHYHPTEQDQTLSPKNSPDNIDSQVAN
jgi:molybdopterin synthase catalytic subunit